MALIATISSPSIRRKFIDLPRLLNRHGVGTKHVGDWQRYSKKGTPKPIKSGE